MTQDCFERFSRGEGGGGTGGWDGERLLKCTKMTDNNDKSNFCNHVKFFSHISLAQFILTGLFSQLSYYFKKKNPERWWFSYRTS